MARSMAPEALIAIIVAVLLIIRDSNLNKVVIELATDGELPLEGESTAVSASTPAKSADSAEPADEAKPEVGEDVNFYPDMVNYMYSKDMIEHEAYNTSYSECYKAPMPVIRDSASEIDNSIDSANALMAQRRARDKKCSDGWASKDKNYFKIHYGWELDESEKKPWWGNTDY